MDYITGDPHRHFNDIQEFCMAHHTTKNDTMTILGDAGINLYGWTYDSVLKRELSHLPITLFCIYGNHEQRPETIETYEKKTWRGGEVYFEKEYPNLLFARDAEIFDFSGKKVIVLGGAYSVDRIRRLMRGLPWWSDEQPSEAIKKRAEEKLQHNGWKINMVFSHTCPMKYEPVEAFLPGINQESVDNSTEEWLDALEDKLTYEKWYCGHWHIEKCVEGKIEFLFHSIIPLF